MPQLGKLIYFNLIIIIIILLCMDVYMYIYMYIYVYILLCPLARVSKKLDPICYFRTIIIIFLVPLKGNHTETRGQI